jgi:hypothetical protein
LGFCARHILAAVIRDRQETDIVSIHRFPVSRCSGTQG